MTQELDIRGNNSHPVRLLFLSPPLPNDWNAFLPTLVGGRNRRVLPRRAPWTAFRSFPSTSMSTA